MPFANLGHRQYGKKTGWAPRNTEDPMVWIVPHDSAPSRPANYRRSFFVPIPPSRKIASDTPSRRSKINPVARNSRSDQYVGSSSNHENPARAEEASR